MIDRFYPTNANFKEREFNGGNITGVIEKLDYIQALGMKGIMLTPFYQTKEYLQEVHKRKMIIVADFVPNHCHISNSLSRIDM